MILEALDSLPPGRVLVAPLNWGLGHAARCVPLIRHMILGGHTVVIAAYGNPLDLLRSEFPEQQFIEFPGINAHYSEGNSQVWSMLRQSPSFLCEILREHKALSRIVDKYSIDIVLSDNRFGLWTSKAYCVYMTHQLMIKMPNGFQFLENLIWRFHRWFISHYDQCWIPDYPGADNLSGDLSHKYPLLRNTRFIGAISRFSSRDILWSEVCTSAELMNLKSIYSTVVVISGPEPHRSMFVKWAVSHCSPDSTLIVEGLPNKDYKSSFEPKIVPHLPTDLLQYYLQHADQIICRSGYSSIMDLHAIGRKANLVATPGQTEQEYLKTLHD